MVHKGQEILTFGYEGTTPERFLALLRAEGVRTVIDVRAQPFSRKPGFSRDDLEPMLQDAGLGYMSLTALGNPPEGRDAAKAGEMETFHTLFARHLAKSAVRKALTVARLLAVNEGPACLVCFEADPDHCHRTLVAEALGFPVRHLLIQPKLL